MGSASSALRLCPQLGRRATNRRKDQAGRHAKFLVQVSAEVVGPRREAGHGRRTALVPGPLPVCLWILGRFAGHGEQPNLGIVRGCDLLVVVLARLDAPPHVRLARADPDFADQYVLQRQRIPRRTGDGYFERLTRLEFCQGHPPSTSFVVAGLGRQRLPGQGNGDLFTRIGPALNRHGPALLQHHCYRQRRPTTAPRPRRPKLN